jgi:uncharacterized membrane protein YdjX (TVP38/TMEM64 family)
VPKEGGLVHQSTARRVIGIVGAAVFISFIFIVSYLVVTRFGDVIRNPLKVREVMIGYGLRGYVAFSIINIFQIFFAPVPGHVVTVSSGIFFGFFRGIIISWISVIIGGSMVMVISRSLGKKLLFYLLDEKAYRFEAAVTRRGIPFILFLSIFPNPIGDGLFYLAGITNVPLKILIPLIALGRLPGIVVSVLLGDRLFMAGIKGWIIGGLGLLTAVILYVIFDKKIERLFEKIIKFEDLQQAQ